MFGVEGGIAPITPLELCGPFYREEFEMQVVWHGFFVPHYKIFIL